MTMEGLSYLNSGIDSCFLLRLDLNKYTSIKKECFMLASGDILAVGDIFSKMGKKGSAGNQQIMPMKPWVQRYLGRLLIDDEIIDLGFPPSYKDRDFVLFDALNTDDLTEGFAFNKKKNAYFSSEQGYVMAYLDLGDGTLLHIRTSGSSSVCKCDCLERVIV
ncbi:hypothetical protein EIJ81_06820 [Aliivibrio salmonicida]|nr:hypothetical protein EIJ81_06820 [Aliivibrio salmonicida]